MASNIKIKLLRNKPKYTANLGENNYRVYTPGEVITGQADFMRFVAEEDLKIVTCGNKLGFFTFLEDTARMLRMATSSRR